MSKYLSSNNSFGVIAKSLGVCSKTIRRRFDKIKTNNARCLIPSDTVIIMDTSYFNRNSGVMVFRDHYTKKNIYWKYVEHETLEDYISGVKHIINLGWNILGIVCDGKRGVLDAFSNTPAQLCQFHQAAIVVRYITRNPKLEAGKELKNIMLQLKKVSKKEFSLLLKNWHSKWKIFLNEKSYNEDTKKYSYTHKRLRSAYRSLNTNLKYLFTYLENPDLSMPNTSNSIEGMFSEIKRRLRNHVGLKLKRKRIIVDYLLSK